MQIKIKKSVEKIPPSVGYYLKNIPYNIRLGKGYNQFRKIQADYESFSSEEKRTWLFENLKSNLVYFYNSLNFYKSFLDNNNFEQNSFSNLENYHSVPILNKKILKSVSLEERSIKRKTLGLFNTGGTSGNPLSFYLEQNHYAKEWSFMHLMWGRVGYKFSDIKLTVRGKSIGSGLYRYNLSQNEFIINSFFQYTEKDFMQLYKLIVAYNIKFLHGYPSSIYMFLKQAEQYPSFVNLLKSKIKGIIFCSEFPLPHFRNFIESLVTENTISFYGHTEGCVLAGELYKKNEYIPYHAYGFTEAVKFDDTYHLVSTNFYNSCTPFIRYDTEDLIEPSFDNKILRSFKIKEGRSGDFITDKFGAKISLTSFFFGRHHHIYNYIDHFQVQEVHPGKLIIYIVSKKELKNPENYFDLSDFQFEVTFIFVNELYRTPQGKVPFLIKK